MILSNHSYFFEELGLTSFTTLHIFLLEYE
jgi:hypothetical protein